jgi:hypothetical protein
MYSISHYYYSVSWSFPPSRPPFTTHFPRLRLVFLSFSASLLASLSPSCSIPATPPLLLLPLPSVFAHPLPLPFFFCSPFPSPFLLPLWCHDSHICAFRVSKDYHSYNPPRWNGRRGFFTGGIANWNKQLSSSCVLHDPATSSSLISSCY